MKKLLTLLLVFTVAVSAVSTFVGCRQLHKCSFGEWVVDAEPTCYVDGSKHRECVAEGCDNGEEGAPAVEVAAIPAAHNMVEGVCSVCGYDPSKARTYKTYTSVSPSNWNELTYQDNNDTQIMSYIGSPFFESDFMFDENGEIVPGQFEPEFSFATAIEDITDEYVDIYGEDETGYAWKITLRDDGKWDNGDPIVAGDFVYSMKEQLNPLFLNYRADSFYAGSVNLRNAKEYAFQGQSGWYDNYNNFSRELLVKGEDGKYTLNGCEVYIPLNEQLSWLGGTITQAIGAYGGTYLDVDAYNALDALADDDGKVAVTDESLAQLEKMITTYAAWGESAAEVVQYMYYQYTYPEIEFSEVGIFAPSDTELVVLLTEPIELLDENGDLTYHVFYEFSSLPLVHEATYEACKVEPETEGGLWTSVYNSSLETTRSWGPYKLTYFQAGKYYVLEKNPHWYGWNLEKYEGQYQTTRIECETITSYETAFMKFLAGDLTGIGIDVSKADQYKNSSRAYFTPDDFVSSMQLQSNKEALKNREQEGINKTLLAYEDFRKAISLSFNRAEYAKTCTTSSLAGYGLFNSMHYYDVAHGGVYRNTDIAKQVLCDVYGVDVSEYPSLDDAYNAITGYDMDQAKDLLEQAYAAAVEAGDIKAGDKVLLTVGTSTDTESTRRVFEFIKSSLENLAVGTSLEGRLTAEFNTSYGTAWANDFRAGAYDICTGGWTGAAWDPGYFLMAYLSPSYMYSRGWDTSSHNLELTVHGIKKVETEGGFEYVVTNDANDSITEVLPIYDDGATGNWYGLLNNQFAQGRLADEFRLEIIGGIEKEILSQYYSVPISYSFGASLISYQVEYITYEYNTFNGYGGIQYMTYKYTDAEWAAYLENNNLDYTK